tara:strand:- start:866 stop:9442 length:8577 start_codon:yes stop_codon:yes gene_type:complete
MGSSNVFDLYSGENEDTSNYDINNDYGVGYNVFDRVAERESKERDKELQILLNSVADNDPDGTGEAQRLAEELGLPKGTIINSSDTLEMLKEKKRQYLNQASDFAMVNPILAQQLRDPNFAAIAHDNLPRLKSYENLWGTIVNAPKDGWEGIRKGVLSREMGFIAQRFKRRSSKLVSTEEGFEEGYEPTEQDVKDFERLKQIEQTIANYDANGVGFIEGSGYFIGQYASSIPEAAIAGVASWKAKTLAGAGIGFLIPDGPLMFAGEAVGGTIGNFVGLFTGWNMFANKLSLDTYFVEGGHSWLEARARGYNMKDAAIRANTVGAANFLIERWGLNIVGGVYGRAFGGATGILQRSGLGKSALAKTFKKKILRQVGTNALSRNGSKLTWNAATFQFAKDYALVLGTETGQELAQEAIAIAGINLFADMSKEDIEKITTKEFGDRIWTTLTETVKGMILFGLVGPGVAYVGNVRKANKAANDTAVLERLANISKDDKTKIRNITQWQAYQQLNADRAGVSDFYFNLDAFQKALDDNQITEEQLQEFSPELANELIKARKEGEIGKVIKIAAGEYIAKISGTDLGNSLKEHLKTGENEMSQSEMMQFAKDQPEQLELFREELGKRKQEYLQAQKDTRFIKSQIAKQLRQLGLKNISTAENARFLAELPVAFANAYAKALNITAREFINRYTYNIVKDADIKAYGKQFFTQKGNIKTDSNLFLNWFGKSKIKKADGKPQVVYHVTRDSFSYFNFNNKSPDSGFAGIGIYTTPDETLAKFHQENRSFEKDKDQQLTKLYVRLINPKTITVDKKTEIKDAGKTAGDGYREQLLNEGHDGIIVKNANGETEEIVIFDSDNVKEANENGDWSDEINVLFEQQERETFEQKSAKQKQGKPVSEEVFQIARIIENFDFAKSKPFATNRDFKLEIQARVQAAAKRAGVKLTDFSVETEKYLVKTLLEDARFALTENGNAVGWYDEKVSKAVRILSKVFPKVATDKRHEFVFKWALAATSNGIKVDKNYEYAADVYRKFLESEEKLGEGKGRLPEKMLNADGEKTGGTARAAMEKSFKILNLLFDRKSFKELEEFMRTMHTVREVHEFVGKYKNGRQIKVGGGYGLDEQVYGAAIMGPKIGNGFFANLNGNYDQLTLDRWAIRTWGRMTGTLVLNKEKQAKIKRAQIKQIIKALTKPQKKAFEAIIGRKLTLGDLDQLAIDIEKASTTEENRQLMAQIATFKEDQKNYDTYVEIGGKPRKDDKTVSLGDYLRKRGNLLAKDNDGQKEAPSGAPERRNIEKVFAQVLEVLQKDYPSLTMADLQALVWYPEKKLYDSAKLKKREVETNYDDNEAPDYANAAVAFAAKMGVPDEDIQSAIKEVDDELQSTKQSTGTQPDDGGRGEVRTDDGTLRQQPNTDERTGLPLNEDGTVTLYYHTDRKTGEQIKATGQLGRAGESNVNLTTRAIADIGLGNTAIAVRIDPAGLSLVNEFPNGRRDFRLDVGKTGGTVQVKAGEFGQVSDRPRGQFEPTTLTTILTQEADFSTFAHETAHYMLTVLENIVSTDNAPPELINDFNILLKFWGVKDLETWKTFDLQQKRKYHEAFAYNFEQYLFDKKAPEKGLQKIFNRFSRVIKDIYKDVSTRLNNLYRKETGKDLPILTDDVRGVMDRMLATDEQIVQANAIYDMKAMFQTQEQSGMNDKEWAAYQTSLQEAEDESLALLAQQSMKQLEWIRKKRGQLIDQQNITKNKLYKKIKKEETIEVQKLPVYRLFEFLKRGITFDENGNEFKVEGDNKISIESLKELVPYKGEMGQAYLTELVNELGTGRWGLVGKKNGLPVQVIADMFGFADGQSMIDALLEKQDMKDVIESRTEERILTEHSDLVSPQVLELQILEAMHNEARSRFVAVELNTLAKSMQPVRYMVAAANQVARDILADYKMSDIRPSVFTRAEARALKEAEAAMKKGNRKAAIKAKRSQLINNQLAKVAIEIHKEFKQADKFFPDFFKTDQKLIVEQKRNSDLINAGRAILASYKIGPKVETPMVYIEKMKEYDEHLYQELEPMILDNQASKNTKEITDLTYEDFQNLYDLAKTLWYQSKREEQIRNEGKLLDLQPIVDRLNSRLDTMIARNKRLSALAEQPIGTTQAVPKSYQLNKFFLFLGSKMRRMEPWVDMMDGASKIKEGTGSAVLELEGGKLGDFYNFIWYPMRSALDEYRVQQTIFTKQYADLVGAVDFGKGLITANEFELVSDNSTAYTFGTESGGRGRVELLGALLHTGNDSNLKKLLLGRGWGSLNEDGSLNRTHWDAFEKRMQDEGYLTQADYEFVQAVWDLNQKMLPILQRAHKDTEGYYFKEVKPRPIINRFGEFRGGYVPAKGDPNMTDISLKEEISALKMEFKNSLPKVENGMTKERKEQFFQPLSLHLGFMTKHIDDTLRYAYIQPVLKDTLKILKNKDFENKLKIIDPTVMQEMIMPWLKSAATQRTYASSMFGPQLDALISTTKRRAGMAIMFGNVGNALQQLTGLFPALLKVKPKYLKQGLIKYITDREKTMQMIAEASPFMADRQVNLIFDIQGRLNELVVNPSNLKKMQNWGVKHSYFLQQTFQGITDAIVWMGTYNQVHETLSKNMSDEAIMKEAIKQADANVRMTQDSLLPEDRAAFQNMDPIVQSFTQFTGYFNMIANLGFTQYQKLMKDEIGFKFKGQNSQQLVYASMYAVVMPAIVAGIIMRLVNDRIEDEDEDGYIHDDMAWAAFGDIVNYTAGLVPVAGQLALLPFNQFDDKPWNDDIVSSPGIEALATSSKTLFKFPVQIAKGELKGRDIMDVSTMFSMFGIPVTPLGRTFGYIYDVRSGNVRPKNPFDFIRGVVTGKASATRN